MDETETGETETGETKAETEPNVAEDSAEVSMEGTAEGSGEEAPEPSSLRYRLQRRGGKGVRDIKTDARNGPVVGIAAVKGDEDIMLISAGGMVQRTHVAEVRQCGRNTKGVRIMNLKEGDRVASMAKVPFEEVLPEATVEAGPVEGTPPEGTTVGDPAQNASPEANTPETPTQG